MTPNKARLAVIGTGWWACDWHIPAILENPDAVLVALADIDPERLARAAGHYDVARTYNSVQDLLANETLDGAVVATNHVAHYEVARACLAQGLHVVVEKPMVLEAWQGKALVEQARQQGRELIAGYPWNYYTFVPEARRRLQAGEFGQVQCVHVKHANHILGFLEGHDEWMAHRVHGPGSAYADPARSRGGYGYTQITHFAGLVSHLLGIRIEQVNALMSNQGLAVDLVDVMAVRFEGGALGSVSGIGNLGGAKSGRFSLDIFCEHGLLEISAYPVRCVLDSGASDSEDLTPSQAERTSYPGKAPVNNLVDVILGRAPNLSPGESGWYAAELLDAAYRSAAADGRPVLRRELYS